jgi:hypothetical protein
MAPHLRNALCESHAPRTDDSLGVVPYCAVRVGLSGLCASEWFNPLAHLLASHQRGARRQTGSLLASSGILGRIRVNGAEPTSDRGR